MGHIGISRLWLECIVHTNVARFFARYGQFLFYVTSDNFNTTKYNCYICSNKQYIVNGKMLLTRGILI